MSDVPITFTDSSYALFDIEQNAVMTTAHGNLAIFSTKGMADIWAARSPIRVDVREVSIKPVNN